MSSDGSGSAGKSGIPSWQNAPDSGHERDGIVSEKSNSAAALDAQASAASNHQQRASNNGLLLDQALKFLKDPSVQHAPPEKKVAFLESKGLSAGSITEALTHITDDSPLPPGSSASATSAKTTPETAPARLASQYITKEEASPIIVYPEFLIKPQKPPPLITVHRLLNTVYVACGAAALIYGTTKYLLEPMIDNLTSARHEFAKHSHSQLDELNRKLGEIVSVESLERRLKDRSGIDNGDAASITESLESDPNELYHRDFGTQTSPRAAASDTSSSTEGDGFNLTSDSESVDEQSLQLLKIKTRLEELRTGYDQDEQPTCAEIFTVAGLLNEHLESLAYPTDSYIGIYSGGEGGKKDEDEITRVKAEIRGVKGVLLSARNFKAPTRGFPVPSTES